MTPTAEPTDPCPLCGRVLGDKHVSEHHLIPQLKKGKDTVRLHDICHGKIHSLFGEGELARHYNTIERLLENEDIQKFVKWVRKKPSDYVDSSRMSKKHPRKRK
jgi:hypothetical protein